MLRYVFLAFILTLAPYHAHSQTNVIVGITSIQPPLAINDKRHEGLIYDVVKLLNSTQDTYKFETRFYPAKRLLAIYKEANIHIVAYNNVKWGWVERGGHASLNLTNGRDLFFRLKEDKDERFMKEIGAVRGFHYAFAGFDTTKLSKMANVSLVPDEESVIRLVEFARVKKGVVSETLLNWIAISQPELFQKLKVDRENPDHTYNRQFVLFDNAPISLNELNALIIKTYKSGALQAVYDKYGLQVPDLGMNETNARLSN